MKISEIISFKKGTFLVIEFIPGVILDFPRISVSATTQPSKQ